MLVAGFTAMPRSFTISVRVDDPLYGIGSAIDYGSRGDPSVAAVVTVPQAAGHVDRVGRLVHCHIVGDGVRLLRDRDGDQRVRCAIHAPEAARRVRAELAPRVRAEL